MTELILNNPWLLWLLILAASGFVFLLIIGFVQGRSISTIFGTIGEKAKEAPPTGPPQQDQTVNQSNIQQTSLYVTASINPEQLDEVAERVASKVKEIQREYPHIPSEALYQLPPIPDRVYYILAVRYYIERRIRSLVLSNGGPWAGASWASFNTYLDYAQTGDVITGEMAQEINDFYFFTQANINSGRVSNEEFLQIQYLALNLMRELEEISLGSLGDDVF